MANSVTVRDIAQGASVSVATVSRVLNNHHHVKEEVRQRVFKAAKELGYFEKSSNQSNEARLTSKQLKEISFIYSSSFDATPVFANPFWSHILQGAEREANRTNIKVSYRTVSDMSSSSGLWTSALKESSLGGILLVGPAEPSVVQAMKETRLPVVMIDNYIPHVQLDAVISDNFEGAKQAVEYLVSKAHKQIAFIGGPVLQGIRPVNKIYTIERRAAGYRTALLDAGLEVNYDLYESSDLSAKGGYQACLRLLEKGNKFTALFCANDECAFGAMKALREAGLDTPEDVSVIGFDDVDMAQLYHPALTTVRVNKEAMGAMAVKTLIGRATDPDAVNATVMLEVELIERESVREIKG
ncbi:MAG TPA: LacI family DNA-binding transcriptional regulator [Chloroflexia bacterium]|nr:LacI family DNA-binding transcriptional regulator [Chloroflexia bacterium]